jgi:hypothetical protein
VSRYQVDMKDYVDRCVRDLQLYHENDTRTLHIQSTELQRQITELHREQDSFVRVTTWEHGHQELVNQLNDMLAWRANVMGRFIAIGFIGAILVAAVAAFVTHLAGG